MMVNKDFHNEATVCDIHDVLFVANRLIRANVFRAQQYAALIAVSPTA